MGKVDPKLKHRLEQLAVGSLLMVFGFTFFRALRGQTFFGAGAPPIAGAVKEAQLVAGQAGKMVEDYTKQLLQTPPTPSAQAPAPVRTYTAEALRDPLLSFLPRPASELVNADGTPAGEEAGPPAVVFPLVTVQGVIWGGVRPQVIIEDHLYDVGDVVAGARIKEIGRDGVTLEMEGATTRVKIAQAPAEDR